MLFSGTRAMRGGPRAAIGWALLALIGKEDVALVVIANRAPHVRPAGVAPCFLGGSLVALGVLLPGRSRSGDQDVGSLGAHDASYARPWYRATSAGEATADHASGLLTISASQRSARC